MARRVEGKVALITGAARGQGRSHAVRLAQEGAHIIAVDSCAEIASVTYGMPTLGDLEQTVREVEALDSRIIARRVDVRDYAGLKQTVDEGFAELGRVDIVSANAGIASTGAVDELPEQTWQDVLDINLTGAWHTVKAAVPYMKAGGKGGAIVFTGSVAGINGVPNLAHYAAAKAGIIGLMRTLAVELGPAGIRVNSVHPTQVDTAMIMHDECYRLFAPDQENPTRDDFAPVSQLMHALPIPWIEPVDVSNAVLFLASDEARYITGTTLAIDAGSTTK